MLAWSQGRTPKHSQVPLVLPQKFINEWTAPNNPLSFSSLPSPCFVLNFQQRIESLLLLRSLMNFNPLQQPHAAPWIIFQSRDGWKHPLSTARIKTQGRPVSVSGYASRLFGTEMGWTFAATEMVWKDLKHYRGRTGLMDVPSFLGSLSIICSPHQIICWQQWHGKKQKKPW